MFSESRIPPSNEVIISVVEYSFFYVVVEALAVLTTGNKLCNVLTVETKWRGVSILFILSTPINGLRALLITKSTTI